MRMRQKRKVPRDALTPDARQEKQPFYGRHQAGIILTPQQASMMLVAFDVLAAG
ncbi:hypothetical protein LNP74_24755 [Klebsiella pneumoniae subsp. pneumoniae]|nr:hypothetical protein [Klebsiella pneumoniae subsp. pneumoniae]